MQFATPVSLALGSSITKCQPQAALPKVVRVSHPCLLHRRLYPQQLKSTINAVLLTLLPSILYKAKIEGSLLHQHISSPGFQGKVTDLLASPALNSTSAL